ncbi:unnamed protein product [Ranitomeya imitator]|uniref:MADF domain-containing protein n=1 Tax=Ranitomeya imitator TaxID=111125 RepID=A0ABN9KYI5_9NEOB|nr:unnamed protein product [Ranitomeya imitator]
MCSLGKHRVTKRGPALSNRFCLPWLPGDFGIVGRWRAVCVTALQRPHNDLNSDAAAIGIVVYIAAASLNVTIEQHPEVWDRSSEKYKGAKRDAWPKIVTALFPEWPNLPTQQQTQILGDVKTRWRSVTDRYLKSLKTPSGSSPPRKRVPYGDQLKFILGSRSLRRTESNISAQTPPDLTDGDTTVDSIGEEVEDCIMNSQESPGNMSLSGRSHEISDSLGEQDVAANTTTSTSSDAGANSGGGVSRHMGRGAASVRPVAVKRPVQKKTKQGQIIEQLTSKTLNLLDNSSKQDEHDKFGSFLADRVRTLPRDKQQMFVTAVNCLLMAIDDTPTLPPCSTSNDGYFQHFQQPHYASTTTTTSCCIAALRTGGNIQGQSSRCVQWPYTFT